MRYIRIAVIPSRATEAATIPPFLGLQRRCRLEIEALTLEFRVTAEIFGNQQGIENCQDQANNGDRDY
jgi:hypothetical protein